MLTVFALTYALLLTHAPTLRFRGVVAMLASVTVVDLWSHVGFAFPSLGAFEALPLAVVLVCGGVELFQFQRRRNARALLAVAALTLPLLAIAAWAFGLSTLLPTHDPIAVPTFAQLIREQGRVPATEAPIDGRPWYYPPGFPIILSWVNWASPLATLWVFKLISVAVIAWTPVTWALVVRRLLLKHVTFARAVVACVFGFVLFDRTLYLAPAYAGKNSQLLAAALVPIVFEVAIANRRSPRLLPVIALAIAGGFLVHFSMLYMFGALVALWLVTRRFDKPRLFALTAASTAIAIMLTVPRMLIALRAHPDARAAALPFSQRLSIFWNTITGARTPGLFIFEDLDVAWPYKGMVLACMGAIVTLLLVPRVTSKRARRIAAVAGCALSLVLVLVGVFSGVVPGPLSADFVRWFAYNFTALAAGLFLVLLADVTKYNRATTYLVGGAVLTQFVFALMGSPRYQTDFGRLAEIARAQGVGSREVARVTRQLEQFGSESCALVSRGTPAPGGRVTQDYKLLEYVRALSPCYLANGSWLSIASGLSRDCDGHASNACADEVAHRDPGVHVYVVEELAAAPRDADVSLTLGPYYLRRTH